MTTRPLDALLVRLNLVWQRLSDPNYGTRAAAAEGIFATLRSAGVDIRDLKVVHAERNPALENSFRAYEEAIARARIPEIEEVSLLEKQVREMSEDIVRLRSLALRVNHELRDSKKKAAELHETEIKKVRSARRRWEKIMEKGLVDAAPKKFSKPMNLAEFRSAMREQWGENYAKELFDRFEIEVNTFEKDKDIPLWLRVLFHLDLLNRPPKRVIKGKVYDQARIGENGEFIEDDGEQAQTQIGDDGGAQTGDTGELNEGIIGTGELEPRVTGEPGAASVGS